MSEKQNGKVRLTGQLKLYMELPAVMAFLLAALNIWIYRLDRRAGFLMLFFVLIYIFMVGYLYIYSKSIVMKDLVEFAAQYGIVQNVLLKELAIPYAILLDDGKAVWMNEQFERVLGGKPKGDAYISKYIPELNVSIFPRQEGDVVEIEVYHADKEYRAELRRVSVEGFAETEKLLEMPEEKEYFIAVYLQDVTELNRYIKENEQQRLVAGLIYIDNYDEVAVYTRGYRILNKVPRMPSNIVDNLVKSFKSFQHILEADLQQLDDVDGIGEIRARTIKQALKRMQEQFVFDNFIL